MLAASLEDATPSNFLANPCPICRNFQPSNPTESKEQDSGVPGDIQAHIMEHLETIALLALPGFDQEDVAGSNVKQSTQDTLQDKLANLELLSNISESSHVDIDSATVQDAVQRQDSDAYELLADDRHWRDICHDIMKAFPEPEDDPVLRTIWYMQTLQPPGTHIPWGGAARERVRRWLLPPRLLDDEATGARGIRGSADWFLASDEFQKWCASIPEHRTLGLCGFPGCGKTVLSATVLEHMRAMDDRFTLHFSFDEQNVAKRTLSSMARSLVFRLYQHSDSAAEHLITLFRTHHDGFQQLDTEEVFQVLQDLLKSENSVFIILDALSESASTALEFHEWLVSLLEAEDLGHVQLLLISNDSTDWHNVFVPLIGEANCFDFDSEKVANRLADVMEVRLRDVPCVAGMSQQSFQQLKRDILEAAGGR